MEQAYYKDGTVQQMAPPYSPGPQHAQTVYYYPSSAHTGQQMQYAVPQQPQTVYAGQYAQQPQPQFVQGTYMAQPMAAAAPVAPNPALGALLMNNLMSHRCDPGQHIYKTEYGIAGIIVAVVCFPIGLFALMCDKKEVCRRCGHGP